ncbi:MAG: glucose-1-phosphate adenylyltransferase [bacterium]
MHNVLALILGGGRGTRLYPLTKERSKPAVSLAGKYRLIDIPISNCLNAGINRIFVLTQFLAQSLNHHVAQTFRFDPYRRGFVNILSAEQTDSEGSDWYEGTADAVRKTLHHTKRYHFTEYAILSGDHIYRMDYAEMVREHRKHGADVTIAALEVPREKVPQLGVMEMDDEGRIKRFVEKPSDPKVIDTLEIPPDYFLKRGEPVQKGLHVANMGVYVFNRQAMQNLLMKHSVAEDFGRQILPLAVESGLKVFGYRFNDYWEDIGTIRSFFDANLGFTDPVPKFTFYDEVRPIFTRPRFLPPSKINSASIERALVGEGCILEGTSIFRCIVGVRSVVRAGSRIEESILMGADYYDTLGRPDLDRPENSPDLGIGRNCTIRRAIVDKNARIGDGCTLIGGDQEEKEGDGWTLSDGILVIHKDAVVPPGTQLNFGG